MQELQPLGHQLIEEKIDTRRVAARPGQARNETKLDRVFGDTEDDRNRRGRSFGREGSRRAAGRGDHRHSTANQISHQRRQAIVLSIQPMVVDRHASPLGVTDFAEAFAEPG
jgi:hypothetical protein